MGEKIRVVILEADSEELKVVDDFEHTLNNMQFIVGGWLEAMTIREKDGRAITVWLDEEGKLNNSNPNFGVVDKYDKLIDVVFGDVLITSCDEEGEAVGLNDEELEYVKRKFDMSRGVIFAGKFANKLLFV